MGARLKLLLLGILSLWVASSHAFPIGYSSELLSCDVAWGGTSSVFTTPLAGWQQALYSREIQARFERKSERLTQELLNSDSTKPYVVDVVGVGAGPQSAIVNANLHAENPNVRSILFEGTDRMGTFDALPYFVVNTEEGPRASGNEFPGSPLQARDFNPNQFRFVDSSVFGQTTAAAHQYADSDIVFNTRVLGVALESTPGAWPAPYKTIVEITLPDGTKTLRSVYSRATLAATGMGRPDMKIAHAPTRELIETEKAATQSALDDPNRAKSHAPGIQSVDAMLRLAADDTSAGRDMMERYGGGSFAVIGPGHGGAIGVEALAGLNQAPITNHQAHDNKIIWIGQKASSGQAYGESHPDDKKRYRYDRVGKLIDDKRIATQPGYLVSIEKVKEGEKERYKLTYSPFRDGSGVSDSVTVDHVVVATGYRNEVMGLFQGLSDEGSPGLSTVHGNRADFTDNPALAHETALGSQVTTKNADGSEKKHPIYILGEASTKAQGGMAVTKDESKAATGGSLDVLGSRSAALGRQLGRDLNGGKPVTRTPLAKASSPESWLGYSAQATLPLGTNPLSPHPLAYEFRSNAELEAKVQMARFLSRFQFPASGQFGLRIVASGREISIDVKGIDANGRTQLVQQFGRNDALVRSIQNIVDLKGSRMEFSWSSRSEGSLREEKLNLTVENTH